MGAPLSAVIEKSCRARASLAALVTPTESVTYGSGLPAQSIR